MTESNFSETAENGWPFGINKEKVVTALRQIISEIEDNGAVIRTVKVATQAGSSEWELQTFSIDFNKKVR